MTARFWIIKRNEIRAVIDRAYRREEGITLVIVPPVYWYTHANYLIPQTKDDR
jgi:hypothetical protein